MREKMRQLKENWTSPNAFPWDELTEIVCGLEDLLKAMAERVEALETGLHPEAESESRPRGKVRTARGE